MQAYDKDNCLHDLWSTVRNPEGMSLLFAGMPRHKSSRRLSLICPDGRSYVGAVRDIRWRGNSGIQRSNPRLLTAFKQYPPENWTFEILEWLPAACSKWQLREAEQRYIDRLQSWSPESGFNILPAVWGIDGPAQRAARHWRGSKRRGITAKDGKLKLAPAQAQSTARGCFR